MMVDCGKNLGGMKNINNIYLVQFLLYNILKIFCIIL